MAFSNINFKFNGIEEAKLLVDVVEQRFNTLQKMVPDGAVVVCEVEFERVSAHQHGRIYRVETNLSIDGRLYRAEATENTFEEAIAKIRDELDYELSRAKDKQDTLHKRAGRALKKLLSRS